MKKRAQHIVGVVIVLIIIVGFANLLRQGDNTAEPKPGNIYAPAFSLEDYNGVVHSLSDYLGTPMVINSWAAWCPFCRKELTEFAAVQEEFGDAVIFVAIDRSEALSVAKRYTDQLGVTDKMVFLLDPSDSFYKEIGGFSMPETIFVDASGFIVEHKRGPMTRDEVREKIETNFGLTL